MTVTTTTAALAPDTVAPSASATPGTSVPAGRVAPLWRVGAVAGAVAAVATSVVAAVAVAADVPLEIAGEKLPVAAFAQLTLIGALLGVLLAKAVRRWTGSPQKVFVASTAALTALSIVPDITADATTATKLVLIATHLAAAAVIVPALARRLPQRAAHR